MHGFTMGVAFIIAANQLNFLLGLPKLTRHPEFMANLFETFKNINQANGAAILFFAISFGCLFQLSRKYGKVPWAVVLAIAADATPVQGIITAVWAGSASAIFGGSHYNIVGPTGALSGILSYYSVTYGSAIQPILAILTGFLCLAVYASRMDKYLVFIPS